MKTMSLGATVRPLARPRVSDYVELTKPRIAVMVLFTVGIGYVLSVPKAIHLLTLFNVMFGTALVAAGANTLNMLMERSIDAKMRRTMNRPLPTGRLTSLEVFLFGIGVSALGLCYLFWTMPTLAAPIVAAITLFSYVLIYTPLKTVTTMNTLVGAVPGALPPLIGWCAGHGSITLEGLAIFFLLFCWQLPHFWAIAWMYRKDYEDGGLRMLPILDRSGRLTGYAMMLTCLLLVGVSLLPVFLKTVSVFYLLGALICGILFFASTVKFFTLRTDRQARKVLRASLLYLPAVLGLWCMDVLVFKAFLPG